MSGDGQSGEPGATLPVQPRVVVKDAAGLVVPAATVTFAIDSGSGTLERTTAITGTDGTASARLEAGRERGAECLARECWIDTVCEDCCIGPD